GNSIQRQDSANDFARPLFTLRFEQIRSIRTARCGCSERRPGRPRQTGGLRKAAPTTASTASTRNTKKKIFATSKLKSATSPNPKNAATRAMMKNSSAALSIGSSNLRSNLRSGETHGRTYRGVMHAILVPGERHAAYDGKVFGHPPRCALGATMRFRRHDAL